MVMESKPQEIHRSGAFKQTNKTHKTGRHQSKGAINKANRGKVNLKRSTKKVKREQRKEDRRNQAVQLRQKKREEVLTKKRGLGTLSTAPFLVAVIALGEDINPDNTLSLLKEADSEAKVAVSTERNVHINLPRFKQRFTFTLPRLGDLYGALDVLKVADSVLFLLSSTGGLEDFGEIILTAALAQRLPSPITAITDLEYIPVKKRHDAKQSLQDLISRWIPDEKVVSLATGPEALAVIRRLGAHKRREILQRDKRSHVIAETVKFDADQKNGTLKAEGFVRGQPLSVNSLISIPGFGQFQMSLIEVLSDPYCQGNNQCSVEEQFVPSPEKQVPLDTENVVDPMDAEQTWPTAEELMDAEKKSKKIRAPKGMSAYQAAWIPDPELVEDDDDDSESENEMEVDKGTSEEDSDVNSNEGDEEEEDEERSTTAEEPDTERYDQKMDLQEEMKALATLNSAKEDRLFPDEVDTPQDTPARIRFQKYRGLQSFRTSTWDPMENLPPEFARIFQFENYDRTRKKVLKTESEDGVPQGKYVRVHIPNVKPELFSDWRVQSAPMVLCAMLPHEQKMSLLNVVIHSSSDQPIKSKESLVFHVGHRRFRASPIFSQHTNGNKHKFERFWQPGSTVVASMYAPVMFAPCSVLVFKENKDGTQTAVGSGDLLSANPSRIVTKRVVLSGHPFKVFKRSAVVRFMFFNREDVSWFKPVELTTRLGRRGHIKEPLGTHGHMKCVFDAQLKSQDTVFMRLYKRVFPPWTYENLVGAPPDIC